MDLVAIARREMMERGFEPEFPREVQRQVETLHPAGDPPASGDRRDLTSLPWSSIDNDDSRDLDQIECAERTADGIRVRVGVADVDATVPRGTPIDCYAAQETTTVYAGVHTFPMLPERLSFDLTSLVAGEERPAVVIEFVVAPDGGLSQTAIFRARVRNCAKLAYSRVGPWLEGSGAAPTPAAEIQAQLKLQDEAAHALRAARGLRGALTFRRSELRAVMDDGHVKDIATRQSNRAADLIEDFMIAANEVMAVALRSAGVSSIRRIVKEPERWARIVELAEGYHEKLPAEPDSGALNQFLLRRRQADPTHYPDISLSVLKLMGPGEYVVLTPGGEAEGHFGLAAHDYTHSTAPNRRFADMVTQRLVKALIGPQPHAAPYSDSELGQIAARCTMMEDAARKVERDMVKRVAAVALAPRIGQTFPAVVTGVTEKGVFVRILEPAVEGRLMHGEHGLDVGDRLRVRLLSTDPFRGFIDFGRVNGR
jgi:VacB/RNase II family 3'-5' exoribonuclease